MTGLGLAGNFSLIGPKNLRAATAWGQVLVVAPYGQ